MDRESAQARLNRIRAFNAELDTLERDAVVTLTDDQRQAIRSHQQQLAASLGARFDLDRDDVQRRMSIGMRIASLIGAAALSAAVFLLFYRVWGDLTTSMQVAVLAASPIVALALAETARRFDRSGHFTFIAAVIACACFVMNVALVGDIFAMADSPNALGVWAAFALLLGYGYRLRLPVAAGLGLAIAFVAGTVFAWRGFDWTNFGMRPELLLPLAAIVCAIGVSIARGGLAHFASTHRIVGLIVLLGALWALSTDGSLSVAAWPVKTIQACYQIAGFIAAAGAIAIGLSRDWPDASNLGGIGFAVFLYTKFYQWWWDWMPAYLFFFIVGASAVAMIVLLNRARVAMLREVAA